jgi:hypothetical protein
MSGRADGLEASAQPVEIGQRLVHIEDRDGGRIRHIYVTYPAKRSRDSR